MLEALSDQQHVWLLVAKKLPFTRVTTPFACVYRGDAAGGTQLNGLGAHAQPRLISHAHRPSIRRAARSLHSRMLNGLCLASQATPHHMSNAHTGRSALNSPRTHAGTVDGLSISR